MSDETTPNVHDRIDRAREQDMEINVIKRSDPTVLEVENHDSVDGESVYTVLPDEMYCGCWDHRARVPVCKHLIHVAMEGDDDVAEAVRSGIDSLHDDLIESRQVLLDRLDEVDDDLAYVNTISGTLSLDTMDVYGDPLVQMGSDENPWTEEQVEEFMDELEQWRAHEDRRRSDGSSGPSHAERDQDDVDRLADDLL